MLPVAMSLSDVFQITIEGRSCRVVWPMLMSAASRIQLSHPYHKAVECRELLFLYSPDFGDHMGYS